jgi:hypothetical protein
MAVVRGWGRGMGSWCSMGRVLVWGNVNIPNTGGGDRGRHPANPFYMLNIFLFHFKVYI